MVAIKTEYRVVMRIWRHWCSHMAGADGSFGNGLAVLKRLNMALAGVAQWIECQPVNQSVTGSIPSQGTCLGCGPGPQ